MASSTIGLVGIPDRRADCAGMQAACGGQGGGNTVGRNRSPDGAPRQRGEIREKNPAFRSAPCGPQSQSRGRSRYMLAYTAPTSVEEAVKALAASSGTAKV